MTFTLCRDNWDLKTHNFSVRRDSNTCLLWVDNISPRFPTPRSVINDLGQLGCPCSLWCVLGSSGVTGPVLGDGMWVIAGTQTGHFRDTCPLLRSFLWTASEDRNWLPQPAIYSPHSKYTIYVFTHMCLCSICLSSPLCGCGCQRGCSYLNPCVCLLYISFQNRLKQGHGSGFLLGRIILLGSLPECCSVATTLKSASWNSSLFFVFFPLCYIIANKISLGFRQESRLKSRLRLVEKLWQPLLWCFEDSVNWSLDKMINRLSNNKNNYYLLPCFKTDKSRKKNKYFKKQIPVNVGHFWLGYKLILCQSVNGFMAFRSQHWRVLRRAERALPVQRKETWRQCWWRDRSSDRLARTPLSF